MAKLESSMTFSGDKLDLKIFGFNEKLPVLASEIAELLTSLVPREDRFQVIVKPTNWFPLSICPNFFSNKIYFNWQGLWPLCHSSEP